MQQTTNEKRILEFIKKWSIKEWRKIHSLGKIGYVIKLRECSEYCLDLLMDHRSKFKKGTIFNLNIFMDITGCQLVKDSDWLYFTSELLKLCSSHIRYSLLDKDNEIFSNIGTQLYLLEQSMHENYQYYCDKNGKDVDKSYKADKSLQGGLMLYYEESLHYDVRIKESRQDLNSVNKWIIGNELGYHENKLKIWCILLGRKSYKKILANNIIDINYLQKIPKEIKDFPQIQLYSKALLLLESKEEHHFDNLSKALNKELNKALNEKDSALSASYLEPLYYHLLNFCVDKILIGKKEYIQKYLDISLKLLTNGLLLEQGYISGSNFKNISNSYIQQKELEKAEKFIFKYKNKLLGKTNNPFFKYCKGLQLYSKNKFNDALKILRSVDTSIKMDDFVKVDIKILTVLCCMQINEHFKFEQEIRNLTLMMNRKNKVSKKFIKIWEQTTQYLKKVYSIPRHEMNEAFPSIIHDIKNDPFVKNGYLIIQYMKEKMG